MSNDRLHSAAILLLNIPNSSLCGIDLLSFTTSPKFRGIKDLPLGYHFVFTSQTSSLTIRDGFWIHVTAARPGTECPLFVRKWDSQRNLLVSVPDPESYRGTLADLWNTGLSPYRQSAEKDGTLGPTDWHELVQHVTLSRLRHLTQNDDLGISSASTAVVDQESIPGLNEDELGLKERELGSLGIDLKKTWPEGATGRERTEAALDSSWALENLVQQWQGSEQKWGDILLGQMEACFVIVLTLANYSCLEEWKRCVGLVLTCREKIREHEVFFVEFLAILDKQMQRCEDVEGGLFDMAGGADLLQGWLKGFRKKLEQVYPRDVDNKVGDEMDELEKTLQKMYDWNLGRPVVRRGMLELEDGETVEMEIGGSDEDDEQGEYAPTVVDLDAE